MKRSVLAGPEGHPLHPFVVPVPVGAFVSSLIFDILTRTRAHGLPYLVDGAFWLIGAAVWLGGTLTYKHGLRVTRRATPGDNAVR